MNRKLLCLFMAAATLASCGTNTKSANRELYTSVESSALPQADERGNIIPDFSRVGYMWGDKQIPTLPVVKTVKPLAAGQDATKMLQAAIDEVSALDESKRGAILLTKGEYIISEPLKVQASGIVLRGESNSEDASDGTVLNYIATVQSNCIDFGLNTKLEFTVPEKNNITEEYVPVGRFWVVVDNAADFKVKDNVCVYYNVNDKWVSDLKMDQITLSKPNVGYWKAEAYKLTSERVVTKISGDTLWFENPIVMEVDAQYGGGSILKYTCQRISNSGVENLFIKSAYKAEDDEQHGWNAIAVTGAEHCWFTNIVGKHFGYGLVLLRDKSKNITVSDCSHSEMKSRIHGGRRYTFTNSGQLSLVQNCTAADSRHSFNASCRNVGPNVYTACRGINNLAEDGPHHRWNVGTLYDAIHSDGRISTQDRDDSGSGHGWTSITNVFWNCEYDQAIAQSPWIGGKNYSIGMIAEKGEPRMKGRPEGEWISHGTHVGPASLYQAQLELRNKLQPGGVFDVD